MLSPRELFFMCFLWSRNINRVDERGLGKGVAPNSISWERALHRKMGGKPLWKNGWHQSRGLTSWSPFSWCHLVFLGKCDGRVRLNMTRYLDTVLIYFYILGGIIIDLPRMYFHKYSFSHSTYKGCRVYNLLPSILSDSGSSLRNESMEFE